MAVAALLDPPSALLLDGLAAVRDTPAPVGQVPARLSTLAHAVTELQGVYLRALDQAEREGEPLAAGCRSTADLLVEHAGLPVAQARSDAAQARRLGEVPGLLDALAGGGLELPAARLVARAWTALPSRLRDADTAGWSAPTRRDHGAAEADEGGGLAARRPALSCPGRTARGGRPPPLLPGPLRAHPHR